MLGLTSEMVHIDVSPFRSLSDVHTAPSEYISCSGQRHGRRDKRWASGSLVFTDAGQEVKSRRKTTDYRVLEHSCVYRVES